MFSAYLLFPQAPDSQTVQWSRKLIYK